MISLHCSVFSSWNQTSSFNFLIVLHFIEQQMLRVLNHKISQLSEMCLNVVDIKYSRLFKSQLQRCHWNQDKRRQLSIRTVPLLHWLFQGCSRTLCVMKSTQCMSTFQEKVTPVASNLCDITKGLIPAHFPFIHMPSLSWSLFQLASMLAASSYCSSPSVTSVSSATTDDTMLYCWLVWFSLKDTVRSRHCTKQPYLVCCRDFSSNPSNSVANFLCIVKRIYRSEVKWNNWRFEWHCLFCNQNCSQSLWWPCTVVLCTSGEVRSLVCAFDLSGLYGFGNETNSVRRLK